MDTRVVLSKIVALIYRSRLISNMEYDDTIRTILQTIKSDSPELVFGSGVLKKLKELCIELLEERELIAKEVLIPRLQLVLESDQKLFAVLKDSIEPEYEESSNKRVCTAMIRTLNAYYKEHLGIETLSKASYELKFNRAKITNFTDYLKNLLEELTPLTLQSTTSKDPAVIDDIDLDAPDTVEKAFQEVQVQNSNAGVYRFGWQDFNTMVQSGIRRGECMTVAALQHKYKSGFTRSGFAQIARYNVPIVYEGEEGKKPLLLYISFEDSASTNIQFLYQYLKANEGIKVTKEDLQEVPIKEASDYITAQLTKTGFSIKILRVDPTQWDYRNVINKIVEYEAQGYVLHGLVLDYITMLPTTGCQIGALGSDRKELLRRIKNFCYGRKAFFITPLQLSSEAKQKLRNGVPDHMFLKEIHGLGFYDGIKTIDQEIDIEVFVHTFIRKGKKYLIAQRGKHRGAAGDIPEEEKSFILPFKDIKTPIIEDLFTDKISFRTMPKDFGNDDGGIAAELFG